MSVSNINPPASTLVSVAETFSCEIAHTGASEVVLSVYDGSATFTIWTLTGGFQAGYTGSANTLSEVTTLTNVTKSLGWWASPLIYTVSETVGAVVTEHSWTYLIEGIEVYIEGTRPYSEEYGDPAAVLDLNDLADVNAPSPADGEALVWDDGSGKWIPGPGGGGAQSLDDVIVTAGGGTVDNDINVPAADPIILRDNGGSFTPFQVEKTDADDPAIEITVPAVGTNPSFSNALHVTNAADGQGVRVKAGNIIFDAAGATSTYDIEALDNNTSGVSGNSINIKAGGNIHGSATGAGRVRIDPGASAAGNGDIIIGGLVTPGSIRIIDSAGSTGALGDVLTSDGADDATWEPGGSGAQSLDDLDDVDMAGVSHNDIMHYNSVSGNYETRQWTGSNGGADWACDFGVWNKAAATTPTATNYYANALALDSVTQYKLHERNDENQFQNFFLDMVSADAKLKVNLTTGIGYAAIYNIDAISFASNVYTIDVTWESGSTGDITDSSVVDFSVKTEGIGAGAGDVTTGSDLTLGVIPKATGAKEISDGPISTNGNDVNFAGDAWLTGTVDTPGVKMGEEATRPITPGAGHGLFWVRDDATPMFTDSAGVDQDLSATGAGDVTAGEDLVTGAIPMGTDTREISNTNILMNGNDVSFPGDIVVTGTVDGYDVGDMGVKLATIETDAKDDQVASEVPFTPAGGLSSTDVQAAIVEAAGSGGGDMLSTNNLSDVDDVATSRTNLGLGTAALLTEGTGDGEVPTYDGANNLTVETLTTTVGAESTEYSEYGIAPYSSRVTGFTIGGTGDPGTSSVIDISILGMQSNQASTKGGDVYMEAGKASGATSDGGDLYIKAGEGVTDAVDTRGEVRFSGGGFSIYETTDHPAPTPTTGRGQLWVRTSDNALMYTSETGTDTNLLSLGGAEVNDLSSAVTWDDIPAGNVPELAVTQYEAALSITESQISDLGSYLTTETNDLSAAVTWANVPDANITVSSVTNHEAALSLTESQVSDLGAYPDSTGQLINKVAQTDGADGWTFIDTPAGGGGGHVIEQNGTPLTARANLNFTTGLIAEDDGVDTTTVKFGGSIYGELNPGLTDGPLTAFTFGVGDPGAAGIENRYYFDETSKRIYRDTGTVWEAVASPAENGFNDRADSVLTWLDPGTARTLQIAPAVTSFSFLAGGALVTKSSAETVAIGTDEGLHFIWYDNAGVLQTDPAASVDIEDLIVNQCLVAVVYWSVAQGEALLVMDERHGNVMSSATHIAMHSTDHAKYGTGLPLEVYDVDGNGNDPDDARFTIGAGSIWDEDIRHAIAELDTTTPTDYPIFYRDGVGGDWRSEDTSYLVRSADAGGGEFRALYNLDTGGTWSSESVDHLDFVLSHLFATGDITNPIIGVMGQGEYNTLALARAGAPVELHGLQLGQLATLTPEFVPIATVILQTSNGYSNAVQSRVRSTDDGFDFIDWRATAAGSGTSATASDHALLTNLQGGTTDEYYHLTSAEDTLIAALDGDLATFSLPASTTITAFAQTFLDDTTQGAVQTTLDVDPAGTDNSTDVTVGGEDFLSLTGQAITANPINLDNLSATGTPSASTYLRGDNTWAAAGGGSGTNIKARCATTANITIASDLNVSDTIDGVVLADGDRVLVKDQTSADENGIYTAGASPARASDFAASDTVAGELIIVKEGTAQADTFWLVTNNDGSDVVDTDDLVIEQTALAGVIDAGQITTGTFDNDRVASSNVTQHVGLIDHDSLFSYEPDQHVVINESTVALRETTFPPDEHSGELHLGTNSPWPLTRSDGADWQAVVSPAADANAIHDNEASEISAITAKATPVAGDFLLIEDSAAANAKKRITIGDLPGGGGGVSGPVSSTDNNIAIWDGTGGDTLQDSSPTITASGGYQAGSGTLAGAGGANVCSTASSGTSAGNVLAGGAFIWGKASGSGSSINVDDDGGIAGGYALSGCDILSSGNGALAGGYGIVGSITASGDGSIAWGTEIASAITASGDNCMQLGPGVNSENISICVGDIGSGGVRLIGDGAAAASPQDGDICVISGDITIESAGATMTFDQPDITGSRAGNAALASLLTALAASGLITDSTT